MIRRTALSGAALAAATLAALPALLGAQATQYVRFQDGAEGSAWGVLQGETIQRLSAAPFDGGTPTGASVSLASVTLLPPATPKTAVVVNVNYPSGVTGTPRERPTIITLPPRAFVGHGAPILRPVEAEDVRAEATVGIVIRRTASNVSAADAADYILGVVPAVDVTAMDWRPGGSQWTRAKGTDTFKPLGPAVVSGVDYRNLTVTGRHNGTALTPVRTADMIWDFHELVEYVSRYMTLSPGDVILAGTAGPDHTVAIRAGDRFEVEIAGVGTLQSPVEAAPPVASTLPPPHRP